MIRLTSFFAAAAFALTPLLAKAHDGLHLHDPYARMTPQAGAVYVLIQNPTATEDRLIGAHTDAADMAMLMTSTEVDGVSSMQMVDGFTIPANGTLVLESGHGHIMLMGLKGKFRNGDTIPLTLTFAKFGDVTLTVPVTSARATPPGEAETDFDAMSGTLDSAVPGRAAAPAMKGMTMPDPAN